MQVIRTKAEARQEVERLRASGAQWALVPTMGALHAGHLSLIARAQPESHVVIASVFVNPLQFGPTEDLERYPRDLDGDLRQLQEAGVQLLFAPEVSEMIDADARTLVEVAQLGDRLCGARRPGHFRGVTTIVAKLLHLLQPHVAVFGLKDAQQAILIRRMVRDLDFPVQLRFAPIVRDPDGLALSSRNRYLTSSQRTEALLLNRSLLAATQLLQGGERRAKVVLETVRQVLQRGSQLQIDYIECVDIGSLQPVRDIEGRFLLAISAQVGDTHLIDNVILDVQGQEVRHVDLEGQPMPGWMNASADARVQGQVKREADVQKGNIAAIVLAAGQGKRMNSDLAKVLHPVHGYALVDHVLKAVRGAGVDRVVVVVGHQAARVEEHLNTSGVSFALQAEQLGTGHAVQQAQDALADWNGEIVVLCGDTPLLTAETLSRLFQTHQDTKAAATVLTAKLDDPSGYGRVIRGADNAVLRIVEQKDATAKELSVHEINSGLYIFASADLWQALTKVNADNAQREYYLTDTLEILRKAGKRVSAYQCLDPREVLGVNNPDQLAEAEQVLAQRVGSA